MKWIKVFSTDVLKEDDFVKSIEVSGKRLCAVKNGSSIFVVQRKCPHAGADLSAGWCQNGHLVCPYHRHEFELVTGRGRAGQGNYIRTYPTDARADGIFVGLKEDWWEFW